MKTVKSINQTILFMLIYILHTVLVRCMLHPGYYVIYNMLPFLFFKKKMLSIILLDTLFLSGLQNSRTVGKRIVKNVRQKRYINILKIA